MTEPLTHWTDAEGCDGQIALCDNRAGENFVWLLLHGRKGLAAHAVTPDMAEAIAAGLVQYAAKCRAANKPAHKCDYCDRPATRAEESPCQAEVYGDHTPAYWSCDALECVAKLEADLDASRDGI